MDSLSVGLIVCSFLLNIVILTIVAMLFLSFKKKEIRDTEKYKVTVNGLLKHIRTLEQKVVDGQEKSSKTILGDLDSLKADLANLEKSTKEDALSNVSKIEDAFKGQFNEKSQQVKLELGKINNSLEALASFEELK